MKEEHLKEGNIDKVIFRMEIADVKPVFSATIREIVISDIGSLWDDYCYEHNVPSEIKLHGISFLDHFAETLDKEHNAG